MFETKDAIANGADEIDMVINLGYVKDGRFDVLLDEIRQIKGACGSHILKVIVETCLLTEEERKIRLSQIVTESGADFIKTSTGFSSAGRLLTMWHCSGNMLVHKYASKRRAESPLLEDAERFIELGATRLGTSRIIKLIKNEEAHGY